MPETPTEYYTSRYSGEEIDRGIDGALQLGGATTKQQALHNIGGRPNRNLLYNCNFAIWQRYPEGMYTGVPNIAYIADGFLIQSSNGSINNTFERVDGGGIKNTSGPPCRIRKRLEGAENLNGKVCTLSALKSNGFLTKSVTITGASKSSDIIEQFADSALLWINSGETVYAMKLELGPTQTLAYQDEDGNWQLFETPDYGEELEKCQRYCLVIAPNTSYGPAGNGMVQTTSSARIIIPTPVSLRINPSLTFSGSWQLLANGLSQDITHMIVSGSSSNSVQLDIASSGLVVGQGVVMRTKGDLNAKIILSADL